MPTQLSSPTQSRPTPGLSASTSSDSLAVQLKQQVDALPMGTFAWNPPKQMKVGTQATVTARIGSATPSAITSGIEGPGQSVTQPTHVTSWMQATLTSDTPSALSVEQIEPAPDAPQLQFTVGIAGHEYAEWKWIVTALHPGTWQLRLIGYVRLDEQNIPSIEMPWTTSVPPVTVSVESPGGALGDFLGNNWQWLVLTALAALTLLATVLALRKGGDKTPPQPPRPLPRTRQRRARSSVRTVRL